MGENALQKMTGTLTTGLFNFVLLDVLSNISWTALFKDK